MIKVLAKNDYDLNARTKLSSMGGEKEPGEPPLFTAMNIGKQEIILSLINNGADYNASYRVINPGMTIVQIKGNYSPLMYATLLGYKDVIKALLEKPDLLNASISGIILANKKDFFKLSGISAIYLAIMKNDLDIVKMLAESSLKWDDYTEKALPGKKFADDYGAKPPIYQYNASLQKQNKLRYTPSLWADFSGKTEMAEYLRSKKL